MTVSATHITNLDDEGQGRKPASGNGRPNFWDQQYEKGHDFGNEPSLTVKILAERLKISHAVVLDIGHGPQPRDTLELVRQGHNVMAVEESSVASYKAGLSYDSFVASEDRDLGKAEFLRGDFKRATITPGHYDGATCHRVLHLVKPTNVSAFVNAIARSLKTGGVVSISARDPRDYNPEQMEILGHNKYEIKSRPGHIVNLWTPEMFIQAFRIHFNIVAFEKGSEMESNQKPDLSTHFTVMVGEKKAKPGDRLSIEPEAMDWIRDNSSGLVSPESSLAPTNTPTQSTEATRRVFLAGLGSLALAR